MREGKRTGNVRVGTGLRGTAGDGRGRQGTARDHKSDVS